MNTFGWETKTCFTTLQQPWRVSSSMMTEVIGSKCVTFKSEQIQRGPHDIFFSSYLLRQIFGNDCFKPHHPTTEIAFQKIFIKSLKQRFYSFLTFSRIHFYKNIFKCKVTILNLMYTKRWWDYFIHIKNLSRCNCNELLKNSVHLAQST